MQPGMPCRGIVMCALRSTIYSSPTAAVLPAVLIPCMHACICQERPHVALGMLAACGCRQACSSWDRSSPQGNHVQQLHVLTEGGCCVGAA
jgi:hypothetical protein